MPPAKITCPECEAVLKVSTPPPPGKKMKCPKCGETFTVPGEPAPVRAAAPAGGKKKPADKPDEPVRTPAPAKTPTDEDDEDGGTYGLVQEPEEEKAAADEEEDEDEGRGKKKKGKSPEINYAPDLSIKDLRGPAQAAVVLPSNLLILYGAIGFIGWLLVLFIVLIPILFPIDDTSPTKESTEVAAVPPGLAAEPGWDKPAGGGMMGGMGGGGDLKQLLDKMKFEKPEVPYTVLFGMDLALLATLRALIFIFVVLPPFFIGMGYGAVIVTGAVKMQSLESRTWGLVASIMNMIPIHTFGLMVLACILLQMIFVALFDDAMTVNLILVGLMVLLGILGALVGLYGLKTLMSQEVIDGFEYKPD